MIYQCKWEAYSRTNFIPPKRIECKCGWHNDTPSKEREATAKCKRCGVLINEKARKRAEFRIKTILCLRRLNAKAKN